MAEITKVDGEELTRTDILLYFDSRADKAADDCYRKALEACGKGRVKHYKVRRTLAGLEGGFGYTCEWECK